MRAKEMPGLCNCSCNVPDFLAVQGTLTTRATPCGSHKRVKNSCARTGRYQQYGNIYKSSMFFLPVATVRPCLSLGPLTCFLAFVLAIGD